MNQSIGPIVRAIRYIKILWIRTGGIKVDGACGALRVTTQPFLMDPDTGVWHEVFERNTTTLTWEARLWS